MRESQSLDESCARRVHACTFPLFFIKDGGQWRHVQSIYYIIEINVEIYCQMCVNAYWAMRKKWIHNKKWKYACISALRVGYFLHKNDVSAWRVFYMLEDCAHSIAFEALTSITVCSRSDTIDEQYSEHTGYNEVGELNNIIILYPVARPNTYIYKYNPLGCWDW